jgi:hypothetical protein
MANRNQDRERFKYGICLNDECSKGKSKEVQQISMRKEFVCAECGSELRECPPPKKKNFTPVIIAAVLVLIAAGVACFFLLGNTDKKKAEPQPVETHVQSDEPQEVEEPKDDPNDNTKVEQPVKPGGSINYGKWSGEWKNGKPHGSGTMIYTQQHLIDSRDPQNRTAEKGDYIIGDFNNGKLVQGVWYDSANNVKGSIIIGM